jgi:hypothetical protein
MLELNVKRGNAESIGQFRVSRTGVISEIRGVLPGLPSPRVRPLR